MQGDGLRELSCPRIKTMKKLAHELRMILFRKCDCDELTTEFERVLELCGCEYKVNMIENDNAIIIDIPNCIQFIRLKGMKGKTCKVYESIPEGSPLEKYKEKRTWQKKKIHHSRSEEKKVRIQASSKQ